MRHAPGQGACVPTWRVGSHGSLPRPVMATTGRTISRFVVQAHASARTLLYVEWPLGVPFTCAKLPCLALHSRSWAFSACALVVLWASQPCSGCQALRASFRSFMLSGRQKLDQNFCVPLLQPPFAPPPPSRRRCLTHRAALHHRRPILAAHRRSTGRRSTRRRFPRRRPMRRQHQKWIIKVFCRRLCRPCRRHRPLVVAIPLAAPPSPSPPSPPPLFAAGRLPSTRPMAALPPWAGRHYLLKYV